MTRRPPDGTGGTGILPVLRGRPVSFPLESTSTGETPVPPIALQGADIAPFTPSTADFRISSRSLLTQRHLYV